MMFSRRQVYVPIFQETREINLERKNKNMKKKFEHERNDRLKKVVCFVHRSIENRVSY